MCFIGYDCKGTYFFGITQDFQKKNQFCTAFWRFLFAQFKKMHYLCSRIEEHVPSDRNWHRSGPREAGCPEGRQGDTVDRTGVRAAGLPSGG